MDGPDEALIDAILANIGREMTAPIECLEEAFAQLVESGDAGFPEPMRQCARTMVDVCGQIDRLTRETLIDRRGRSS